MAISDISLTSGMRSNLLSLQGTVDLLNRTQERLSSGKKVNTAIDNPTSYFASQSLTSRANLIDSMKDAMGQAVQTITAADKGITAITAMIEQAKGIAESALSAEASTGNDTLDVTLNSINVGDTITIGGSTLTACTAGVTNTTASIDILFGANMAGGETINVGGQTYTASVGGTSEGYTIVIGADAEATSNQLFARINAQQGGIYTATGATANTVHIVADATGGLTTTTVALGTYAGATITNNAGEYGDLEFERTGNDIVDAENLAAKFLASEDAGIVALRDAGWTVTADNGVLSIGQTDKDLDLDSVNSVDVAFLAEDLETGDTFVIAGTTYTASIGGTSEGLTFAVNGTPKDDAESLQAAIEANAAGAVTASINADGTVHIVGGTTALTDTTVTTTTSATESTITTYEAIEVSNTTRMVEAAVSADVELANLVEQYNQMRTQIDELAQDAGYKGKNLLYGATEAERTLTVKFEGSDLDVVGFDATSTGLNVTAADSTTTEWTAAGTAGTTAINTSIDQLNASLDTLRQKSSALAGNLSIISVRQDFSTNMINTLTEGADKLTLADTNEEGANMLMLQTRQSLSTTALSLAAQAAQSVLKLFG